MVVRNNLLLAFIISCARLCPWLKLKKKEKGVEGWQNKTTVGSRQKGALASERCASENCKSANGPTGQVPLQGCGWVGVGEQRLQAGGAGPSSLGLPTTLRMLSHVILRPLSSAHPLETTKTHVWNFL